MANNAKSFGDYAQGKGWGEGGGDFENLPDGSYVGLITAGALKQNGKQLWRQEVRLKIVEAENDSLVGKLYFDHRPFETEKNGWNPWKVREFYEALGLELPGIEKRDDGTTEIEEVLANIVASGMIVTFDLKTKGDFQNMNIVEAHETAMEEAVAPAKTTKAASKEKPKISREAAKATERDPEPDPAELPTEEEVENWDKGQCSDFCEEHDIQEQKTLSKTKAKILEWLEENASEEVDEPAVDTADAELKERLIEFGAGIGAELNESMSVAELKEELLGYEIEADTMTAEEIKFCKENGIEGCIVYPAPKKAAKKK